MKYCISMAKLILHREQHLPTLFIASIYLIASLLNEERIFTSLHASRRVRIHSSYGLLHFPYSERKRNCRVSTRKLIYTYI